jgi:hypothetical protein
MKTTLLATAALVALTAAAPAQTMSQAEIDAMTARIRATSAALTAAMPPQIQGRIAQTQSDMEAAKTREAQEAARLQKEAQANAERRRKEADQAAAEEADFDAKHPKHTWWVTVPSSNGLVTCESNAKKILDAEMTRSPALASERLGIEGRHPEIINHGGDEVDIDADSMFDEKHGRELWMRYFRTRAACDQVANEIVAEDTVQRQKNEAEAEATEKRLDPYR